jgi:hypothetical protein
LSSSLWTEVSCARFSTSIGINACCCSHTYTKGGGHGCRLAVSVHCILLSDLRFITLTDIKLIKER